ncbi:MAG: hypothetical protein ACOC1F_13585 [Myxococcota bacterium]
MRLNTLGWTLGLAGLLAVGCTIQQVTDDDDGNAGAGGEAGTGGGTAGTGGAEDNPCGDVPLGGECVDDSTIRACLQPDGLASDEPPRIVETTCPPGRTCRMGINGAERCVRTCVSSGVDATWSNAPCPEDEKCVPHPSKPASCQYVPSSSGGAIPATLAGRIMYEYRGVREDNLGWSEVRTADAFDMYVTIFDDGEFIGAAITGWDAASEQYTDDRGSFVAVLKRELKGPTEVWAWPLVFNYTTGKPLMAVAKLKNTDVMANADEAHEYWAWGIDIDPTTTDFGTWTITEDQYSGAIRIFSWIDYGLLRTSNAINDDQMSVAVFWDPNVGTPSCGACFCGPACGGAELRYGETDAEIDYYDTWIALGGPSSDGQTEWASSVVSHELGHYVMHNYSLSPGEGGPHYVNAPSRPGLAYSEAWATAFGSTNVGSPIYVDEQSGTFFWVDISKYTYSGGPLQMPDPDGPIDQYINENVGAGMIWKMFVDQSMDADGLGMGDGGVFNVLTHDKLVDGTYNRGYHKVDLVDFFDAAIPLRPCNQSVSVMREAKRMVHMTMKSNSWLGAGALCALLAVAGCTPNGNSNGGASSQPPAPMAQQQPGPTQRGMTAPVILNLRGPNPPLAKGNITLDLEIVVNEPIHAPVNLRVMLPEGTQLVSGQPHEVLHLPQAGKLYRQYVVHALGPLNQPVQVEAVATGPNNAWGFRAHRQYPAAANNLPPYPRTPSMGRPPARRP